MSKNKEIGDIFDRIAGILDLLEDNPFRIRAYRNAARNIRELTENVEHISERDELTKIPGIGTDLAHKIKEFITTGKINDYEKLKKKVPEGLVELLAIQGLGPRTLAKLNKELGIALPLAEELIFEISRIPGTEGTIAAGSLRRMKETVGDIDILIMAENGERVVKAFTKLSLVKEVLASGDTKGSVILKNGMQVDLRVVEPGSYGAALQYFTGSKAHNIKLRTIALDKGLKINEYGVFRGTENIAGETEEEIYKTLELPWIPPEIREDKGEIEAALNSKLPTLVELKDIRGDLHMHSKWSDGKATIE